LRILWFCNTPGSGVEYLKLTSHIGGWMSSLDKKIAEKVELHLAFYYYENIDSFVYRNIYFHPICIKLNIFQKLKYFFFPVFFKSNHLKRYLKLVEFVKPDLIHIHGTENSFGCLTTLTSIPIVISIQGNITIYKHKYFNGIEKLQIGLLFTRSNPLQFLRILKNIWRDFRWYKLVGLQEQVSLRSCKWIFGRTDWDKRISSILSPEGHYLYLSEVLRPAFYNSEWNKEKNSEKIIIHTTTGVALYKGFETICHALVLLNSLQLNVEWQVAGLDSDDDIVQIVEKLMGLQFPQKNLRLLGLCDENSLIKKMLDANIYVTVSHIENSPNNLCEAMVLGMPCIATYAGGTGSIIQNFQNGLIVQDGDPWVLCGAILELINDYPSAVQLGRNARKTALRRHDPEEIAKQLLNHYTYIIKSTKI